MADMQKKIEWEAPEYEHYEKSADWFWGVGIITIALVISSFFLKSFPLGILVALGGFSIAIYGAKKPSVVSFNINPKGIQIGNKIFDYENLKSFWIDYDPPYKKEIHIESKRALVPHFSIPIGDEDPEQIRAYLLQFIKEEKIDEPFSSIIARILKF